MFLFLTSLIIILSCVNGFSFYQLNASENENIILSNHNKQLEQSIDEVTNQKKERENQLNYLNNEIIQQFIKENDNKIKITKFNIPRISSHPPGVHLINISMTIHNYGVNDVSNLVVLFNFTNSELSWNSTIDVIHTGENINLNFRTGMNADPDLYKSKIVATIYTKDLLLDEVTLISPIEDYF